MNLSGWAGQVGVSKLGRLLGDAAAVRIVVEHLTGWPGFGVEHLQAALAALAAQAGRS
jgi:hypothetical protein